MKAANKFCAVKDKNRALSFRTIFTSTVKNKMPKISSTLTKPAISLSAQCTHNRRNLLKSQHLLPYWIVMKRLYVVFHIFWRGINQLPASTVVHWRTIVSMLFHANLCLNIPVQLQIEKLVRSLITTAFHKIGSTRHVFTFFCRDREFAFAFRNNHV